LTKAFSKRRQWTSLPSVISEESPCYSSFLIASYLHTLLLVNISPSVSICSPLFHNNWWLSLSVYLTSQRECLKQTTQQQSHLHNRMASAKKARTSSDVDPYSAAHIYYGTEANRKSKNHIRARSYSSVSRALLFDYPAPTDRSNPQNPSSASVLSGLFEVRKPRRRGSHGKLTSQLYSLRHYAANTLAQMKPPFCLENSFCMWMPL
jgi:hypothetical protein